MHNKSKDDLNQEDNKSLKSAQTNIKMDLDFINDISLKPHQTKER
jgi:hypothetical protein